MPISSAFWHGKRVFLTGHTGFKGSWLCLWLQSMGAKITGYSIDVPTQPSLFEIADVAAGMRSVLGDICDSALLQATLNDAQAEIVIHMAAQSLVRHSYNAPVDTYATNVMGTLNLLEAVRNATGVKAVLIITSDKCYENREWEWGYRENEAMGGHDPYSSSKACAEVLTASYRQSYFSPQQYHQHGVAVATCRAGNVIGGGDWASDRLIPDMMRAIEQGTAVTIRNPDSVRPWQHVLEPLSGYLQLAQKLVEDGAKYAEAWNFGPSDDDAQPVKTIVAEIARAWGDRFRWQMDADAASGGALHEAHYLKLDCAKAKTHLHWHPKWPLAQALQQVCAWHRAYLAGENMKSVCLNQINQYQIRQYEATS